MRDRFNNRNFSQKVYSFHGFAGRSNSQERLLGGGFVHVYECSSAIVLHGSTGKTNLDLDVRE